MIKLIGVSVVALAAWILLGMIPWAGTTALVIPAVAALWKWAGVISVKGLLTIVLWTAMMRRAS